MCIHTHSNPSNRGLNHGGDVQGMSCDQLASHRLTCQGSAEMKTAGACNMSLSSLSACMFSCEGAATFQSGMTVDVTVQRDEGCGSPGAVQP